MGEVKHEGGGRVEVCRCGIWIGDLCMRGIDLVYLFKMSMTVSRLQDSRTAWSPRREVMVPKRRTVEMAGWAEGAKAWRWEGRMRGVGRDIFSVKLLMEGLDFKLFLTTMAQYPVVG